MLFYRGARAYLGIFDETVELTLRDGAKRGQGVMGVQAGACIDIHGCKLVSELHTQRHIHAHSLHSMIGINFSSHRFNWPAGTNIELTTDGVYVCVCTFFSVLLVEAVPTAIYIIAHHLETCSVCASIYH